MGRTNSTYRNHLDDLKNRFKSFRRGLRYEYRDSFDRLWEHAHRYSGAASYMNSSRPGTVAVFSMLVGMQHQINDLEQRLGDLEECTR